jgi:ubiquinone/menaquinone biosynthesis C-methylase UbiE
MKNILNEKPSYDLHGRQLFSTQFVQDDDIINKDVLDIGCGYGWFELDAIKNNVKKIIGFEASETDLLTAKDNIHNDKVEFITYKDKNDINPNTIRLPFNDNSFNTVVSWEVIEHIPKGTEPQYFNEIYRVLKNNIEGGYYIYPLRIKIFFQMFLILHGY